MATITGSGKFVAIAASSTQFDYIWDGSLSGIVFGVGSSPYCRVSTRYTSGAWQGDYYDLDIITGTALCIDSAIPPSFSGTTHHLYLEFPSLTTIKIGNRVGYTGSIKVAKDMTLTNKGMWQTNYKTYNFKCGLLMNV